MVAELKTTFTLRLSWSFLAILPPEARISWKCIIAACVPQRLWNLTDVMAVPTETGSPIPCRLPFSAKDASKQKGLRPQRHLHLSAIVLNEHGHQLS